MTISKTAYDTTTHVGYVVHKTQDALRNAMAVSALKCVGPNMFIVQDGDNYRNAIPGFVHPLVFTGLNKEDVCIAVDMRPFGSWSKSQDDFVLRNTIEAKFLALRLRLNKVWISESPTYLRNISGLPLKTYASWISESLAHRFSLEPAGQMKLAILAGIFYTSQFSDEKDMHENERIKMAGVLARELNVMQNDVLAVLDEAPTVNSLSHFCDIAADVCQAIQLAELKKNVGLFIAAMGGGWFGVSHKEVLAAALEHPPTFIAMCYTAGTDRSYRSSRIASIFERHAKRGDVAQMFYNALDKMLGAMAPVSY